MNNKFLKKLALCLIISICASGNIVQSMEGGEQIVNIANENNTQVINNNYLEGEQEKFNVSKNHPISSNLDVLCNKQFDESSSPESIIDYIIKSANFINDNEEFKNKLKNLLADVIEKSNEVHYPESPIDENLQKKLIEECNDLIINQIGAKLNQFVILKSKLKNLSKKINSIQEEQQNIDPDLVKQMNLAMNNILKKKQKQ